MNDKHLCQNNEYMSSYTGLKIKTTPELLAEKEYMLLFQANK